MTDLEICKRIAEIEGLLWVVAYPNTNKEFIGLINGNDLTGTPPELIGEYNPLTDKALCFDLMVKHNIEVTPMFSGCWCATVANKYTFDEQIDYKLCLSWLDENPQKAICLAIIEAHKNE